MESCDGSGECTSSCTRRESRDEGVEVEEGYESCPYVLRVRMRGRKGGMGCELLEECRRLQRDPHQLVHVRSSTGWMDVPLSS